MELQGIEESLKFIQQLAIASLTEECSEPELFLLLYLGFNRCLYQLPRSCKRHKENRSKIGQERNSMNEKKCVSIHKTLNPFKYSRMNQVRS